MSYLRFSFTVILLIFIQLSAGAVVAADKSFSYTQPDGSSIKLRLFGDEHNHYFLTPDSIPVFESEGVFYYGEISNGEIKISDVLVKNISDRDESDLKFANNKEEIISLLRINYKENLRTNNSRRIKRLEKSRKVLGGFGDFRGTKKGLVILVNFSDIAMSSPSAQNDFNRMFNEEGYSDFGAIGSVKDYFRDQSYGQFELDFDVVGPVTVSRDCSYYGHNDITTNSDANPRDMIVEACQLVDNEIDFSQYDWDGDGEVEQVFVIYAGYAENNGAPSITIWPHEWALSDKSITLDGVKIDTYACSSELRGTSGMILSGIGVACHEFSHCLGYPDLYDTDYSGAFGMSYWDLMSAGSHCGPDGYGEVPYGYSAYERWMAGWLEPTEISQMSQIRDMKNLGDTPEAYIIYNEGNPNEYYLFENHQSSGWYQYCGTNQGYHGMMVMHVDYNHIAWASNAVNPNPSHQRMTLIAADNNYAQTATGLAGDLFPGSMNITSITNYSHKNFGGRLYNENIDGSYKMNISVYNIEEAEGIINFDVIFAKDIEAPQIKEATNITETSYTANWEPIRNASYYEVEQSSIKYVGTFAMPVVETKRLVLSNFVDLNWLDTDNTTKYRVRAVVWGMKGSWSEFMEVDHPSGVNELNADDNIQTKYFGIDGIERADLEKGINIVKKGSSIQKIYVP